jgi:hypothetical protein
MMSSWRKAEEMANNRQRMLFPNHQGAPQLYPELAVEIGLFESLLLAQIDYWISISTAPEQEGYQWTYQSTKDIQDTFPFMSSGAIQSTVKTLEGMGLIIIGNFNRRASDKTRWFRLNFERLATLRSVGIGDRVPIQKMNRSRSRNEGAVHELNNVTIDSTIDITRETSPENSHEADHALAKARARCEVVPEKLPPSESQSATPDNVPPPIIPEKTAKILRPDQLMLNALTDAIGKPETKSGWGPFLKAGKELRDAGVLPEEIPKLVANGRARWPNVDLTPTSLAKNLHLFRQPPPPNGKGTLSARSVLAHTQDDSQMESLYQRFPHARPGFVVTPEYMAQEVAKMQLARQNGGVVDAAR